MNGQWVTSTSLFICERFSDFKSLRKDFGVLIIEWLRRIRPEVDAFVDADAPNFIGIAVLS
jgi:hypothetical protein